VSGDLALLGAVLFLFLVSIWLAVAETGFVRMSRIRALALAEEGKKGADRLSRMLEQPEQTLNVVLLVVLICQLGSATIFGIFLANVFGPYGVVIGIVLNITAFFVFGEVAPKTFAVQHTERAALLVARPLWLLTNFPPLRWLSRLLIGMANVVLPGKGIKEGPFVTEAEIRQMADVAAAEREIEREERKLIHSIFEFGDTVVREVMLPRPDMVAIAADATIEQGIRRAIDGGFSRIPAFEHDADHIVGLVYLKDLVRYYQQGEGGAPVQLALREAKFVPEQKRVAELLREMQRQQFHMAIVVDEHGGTAGLVTMEDLLEEIVGEIADEYDVEGPRFVRLPGGALRVPGRLAIDDVNEELGIDLPADEWDTVGGLVFNLLGKVPAEGETVRFQGLEFVTERVQGQRIVSVQIRALPGGDGAGDRPPQPVREARAP
jgi:CBS domain containing-hemolysin-like protein